MLCQAECEEEHNTLPPHSEASIQDVSGRKVNILGGHSKVILSKKRVATSHMSNN
jgi:hypothetical protein